MRKRRFVVSALAAGAIMALGAPGAWADDLVGTQEGSDRLFFFDSDTPREVDEEGVEGLDSGEDLLGVDVRPSTGGLYVLGDHGNLYVVNTQTHHAVKVASLPLELDVADREDVNFGIDFNPATDRLRVVSDDDENYSVNPDTGAVTVDSKIQYSDDDESPAVRAIGYTNPPPGQTAVISLFAIDSVEDALYQIAPPASGVLRDKETLDINVRDVVGLDIAWNNEGFLVTTDRFGVSRLFELDLVTGDVRENRGLDREDHEIGRRGLNGVATLNVPRSVPAATPAPTTPTTPPRTP